MMHERSIKLTIASKIDYITLLSKATRAVCSIVVSDEILLYNLELCLVEATTNIINHAYHRNPENIIEVLITINDHQIVIQTVDSGEKYVLKDPKKDLDLNLDSLSAPEGGMGLYLMHQLMDEISFEELDGKNVLTMKKNISSSV